MWTAKRIFTALIKVRRGLPSVSAAYSSYDSRHEWLRRGGLIRSRSTDVFTNLAFEDWIYRHGQLEPGKPLLMLWRNRSCVVIGRHQNPWTEARLGRLAVHGDNDDNAGGMLSSGCPEVANGGEVSVALARRNSGGGTVYHDLGNLNCTFFTARSAYNRRLNLELICDAIRRSCPQSAGQLPLDVTVSPREDILLDKLYKISGTAAKLGRTMAYHHCTILSNVNTSLLSYVLASKVVEGFESRATRSVKSPVKNLRDAVSAINCSILEHNLGNIFLHHNNLSDLEMVEIDPSENDFPGLIELEHSFRNWEWIYGKCPQFSIERKASVPLEWRADVDGNVTVTLKVIQGVIQELCITPDHWMEPYAREKLNNVFVGKQFPQRPCQITRFSSVSPDINHPGSRTKLQVSFISDLVFNCMNDML